MNETVEFIKNTVGNSIERAYRFGLEEGVKAAKPIQLTREEFMKLWEAEEIKEQNGMFDNDCFQPMTVHWNGFFCYVGTGVQIGNYIIPAIKDINEELDEEDDRIFDKTNTKLYVSTSDPNDVVTLLTIFKRYCEINEGYGGFEEYVKSGFINGNEVEYIEK